ncbi:hypothetical protein PanWU01x14_192740 [Parasponia andersonii]|uniref:Uncharacterized protein n=1 Tax=Parasponia andersonii TaxID=3476 RepID=A0A2P5C147_PARAD|nr:hypothetical protein PanWU01x14_192740 [Parasponia andersonii]
MFASPSLLSLDVVTVPCPRPPAGVNSGHELPQSSSLVADEATQMVIVARRRLRRLEEPCEDTAIRGCFRRYRRRRPPKTAQNGPRRRTRLVQP